MEKETPTFSDILCEFVILFWFYVEIPFFLKVERKNVQINKNERKKMNSD